MKINNINIDRRKFILGNTLVGLGILFQPVLAGCSALLKISDDVANSDKTSLEDSENQIDISQSSEDSSYDATSPSSVPKVYFTKDISPEGLAAVYSALGFIPTGNVAVKISTGEPGGHNYLKPELIADFVRSVNGTIVECNTAYGGPRSTTEAHLQAAAEHGFTAIADVDIMDADGSVSLPIDDGLVIKENFVGSHFLNYDTCIALSHFKGHAQGGFGGALKNCSIGIASSKGKSWIHSGGESVSGLSGNQDRFLEAMAEATKSVIEQKQGNMAFINVMNNLSVDCDCSSNPAAPTMKDIGILASLDPVALDKACVDLVYAAPDGQDVIERIESRNGLHIFDHAQTINLGSLEYELVEL